MLIGYASQQQKGGGFDPAFEYSPDPNLAVPANFTLARSTINGGKWIAVANPTSPFIILGGTNHAVTVAALKAGTYQFRFSVLGWTLGASITFSLDVGGSNATNFVAINGDGEYICNVVLLVDATFNIFRGSGAGANSWNIGPISLKRIA